MAAAGVAVLLNIGVALGKEEPQPDLEVDKTGPSEVVAAPNLTVEYTSSVTNVGDAPAVIPSD